MLIGALERAVPAASGMKQNGTVGKMTPCSKALHGFNGALLQKLQCSHMMRVATLNPVALQCNQSSIQGIYATSALT